ncbi:MAG: ribonuclease HII [Candidatus Aminicenantales bacterium]
MVNFAIERQFLHKGFRLIAGVDEVGRGALFGPVVAAAVILPAAFFKGKVPDWVRETKDSKLLTPGKRQKLARQIASQVESLGIGLSSNIEVDEKNVYWASLAAMERAVQNLHLKPDVLLVDGFLLRDVPCFQEGIPQGDQKSISIAAASIVAKVLRDDMMVLLDEIYGGYALKKNKGYGTKKHYQALKELGRTSFHRLSFNLKL